jgi:GTP diphosphokinase / guanosine-3',5'-bis(diphosphate) 3'-diphosphatase
MFTKEGYDLTPEGLHEACEKLGFEDSADVKAAIGEGRLAARQVLEAIYPGVKTEFDSKVVNISRAREKASGQQDSAILIKGLTPGLAVHLSECCHPLPGDRIVGILQQGKGVDVHTIDCEAHGILVAWKKCIWGALILLSSMNLAVLVHSLW